MADRQTDSSGGRQTEYSCGDGDRETNRHNSGDRQTDTVVNRQTDRKISDIEWWQKTDRRRTVTYGRRSRTYRQYRN